VSRYDAALFPTFRVVFESPAIDGPLRFLALSPEEAGRAVVMENHAGKDVTALVDCWTMTSEDGKTRTRTTSSDSYMVDVYHPVLRAGDRKLIMLSTSLDESLIEHVLRGGGCMGVGTRRKPLIGVTSLRLDIDMLLFADGEITGRDSGKFARELRFRKPAAEFVAKQVRRAKDEGRDVEPVLSALAEIPCLGRLGHAQGDPLVHWTRHHARDYLRSMNRETTGIDWAEARLRYLENRPTLPKFYRRKP
jgi:hypothetical protein